MLRVASFFSGVGGIDLGFLNTGLCEIVYANEIDKYPAQTYQLNFDHNLCILDIHDIDLNSIPDFGILTAGFPCQPFSIAGSRQGFDDKRGLLFFELVRIIKEKRPKVLFFENVKGLVTYDNGFVLKTIYRTLMELDYTIDHRILNALEYGNMPQYRERVYIIAFLNKSDHDRFVWPEPMALTRKIRDVIDFEIPVDEKYYYRPGKHGSPVYERLNAAMRDDDILDPSVYQYRRVYVRKKKGHVFPTLVASMGSGGHNVSIIKTKHGIRKLTPFECFLIQGFPDTYTLPDQTDSRLYKQAGNSVCVPVVRRIAERIADVL